MKELQSLALDVKVLREDETEVELIENIDYGDTDLHAIIEGDKRYDEEKESYERLGFSEKKFDDDELIDIEEEEEDDEDDIDMDMDDDDFFGVDELADDEEE